MAPENKETVFADLSCPDIIEMLAVRLAIYCNIEFFIVEESVKSLGNDRFSDSGFPEKKGDLFW